MHSSGELGIQLATMLHLGAVLPNWSYTADAHYHHLRDDVIAGGPMRYEDGAIRVPDAPGLGVDAGPREARASITSCSASAAATRTIAILSRPGWFAHVPNQRLGGSGRRCACRRSDADRRIDDGERRP